MAYKVIVFTGLPPKSALNWNESELLQAPLPPFYSPRPLTESNLSARWRSLQRISAPLFKSPTTKVSFFTMGTFQRYSGDSVSLDGEEEILSEFYDHSFALHEGIHRSFLSDTRSTTDDSGFTASFEDEDSMSKPSQSSSTDKDYGDARCLHGHLSDVEDIPSATYLQSVAPRTVVVNLIVAIISIRQRRRVLTRWGHEMDIVELLLGDETKSGFRVSCWVQPSKDGTVPVPNSLDDSLRALRLRDVILLQFVALSCFRGQVYGQSLRQNMTKIHILDREVVSSPDGVDTGNTGSTVTLKRSDPQAMKVRRVRHWIRNFVAPGVGGNDLANDSFFVGPAAEAAELPPDTQ